MPDLRNCKKCGKMFNYIGGPFICQPCKDEDEKDFKRVKEYLYSNPGATMSEVSEVLEVSVEKITRFLKEGRLEIVGEESNFILECESCGKSIRTGRYCDECSREVERGFKSAVKSMSDSLSQASASKKSIGMRYLNKDVKDGKELK